MHNYTITPSIALHLMRIEGIKETLSHSSECLSSFRTFHTSQESLNQIKAWTKNSLPLGEHMIHRLYALESAPFAVPHSFSYRMQPLIIRDTKTNNTRYLPPNPSDIPILMKTLLNWISKNNNIPTPLIAAIALYQFHVIMPFENKNSEVGCLLSTLILNLGGYGLQGFYSLGQLYDKNQITFQEALYKNTPHNYYLGDTKPDITPWITYFMENLVAFFESVSRVKSTNRPKPSNLKRTLDPKQRKAMTLFKKYDILTAQQIGSLFNLKPRTRAMLCNYWTKMGFLEIVNSSNKGRTYKLAPLYEELL